MMLNTNAHPSDTSSRQHLHWPKITYRFLHIQISFLDFGSLGSAFDSRESKVIPFKGKVLKNNQGRVLC